jgi:hypothetical protein
MNERNLHIVFFPLSLDGIGSLACVHSELINSEI